MESGVLRQQIMALRWIHDRANSMDRVIITDEWPSVRVRQRIVDALDRAGRTRQHMPVLIDLREVSTNAIEVAAVRWLQDEH